jgi:hypothetical protein
MRLSILNAQFVRDDVFRVLALSDAPVSESGTTICAAFLGCARARSRPDRSRRAGFLIPRRGASSRRHVFIPACPPRLPNDAIEGCLNTLCTADVVFLFGRVSVEFKRPALRTVR